MSEKKIKLIHLLYGIFLSASVIITALSLILSCYGIYHSTHANFTREIVVAQLSKISVVIYIFIALVLGGIILSIALPVNGKVTNLKKNKKMNNYSMTRQRLAERVDINLCTPELAKSIKNERTKRKIASIICAFICTVTAVFPLIRIANPTNYEKYDINGSIIPAVAVVLVWCVVALIFCLACSIICHESKISEVTLLKEAISHKCVVQNSDKSVSERKKEHVRCGVRIVVLVVALTFVIVGIINGGMADVLGKAIRLCTECIGLG